jgi:hypothetical protein
MVSIDDKERNLFNATETLAQFYDEIESFLSILHSHMGRAGFDTKAERLRSGTITVTNLSRRLLATATVIYIRGVGDDEDIIDAEEIENEEEEAAPAKGKAELPITPELHIPFALIALFEPRTIPTARTLSSPKLCIGTIGDMSFIDKKTGQPATPDSPTIALSSLANLPVKSKHKQGDAIRIKISKPGRMKKYLLVGNVSHFESMRLLEFDSQEKIRSLAERLVAFTTI